MAVFHSNDAPTSSSDLDSIDDAHTAARAYLALKHNGSDRTLSAAERRQAHALLLELVDRWPDVADTAATAADHELAIEGNPELRHARDQHRAEQGTTAAAAARARRRKSSPTSSGPGDGRRPARGRGRPSSRRSGSRGRGSSILPTSPGDLPGYTSGGQLLASLLAGTVVLTLVYLLLSNADRAARGTAAVELVAGGFLSGLRRFLAPIDPLGPKGGAGAGVSTAASSAIGRSGPAIADALGKRAAALPPLRPLTPSQRRPTHG